MNESKKILIVDDDPVTLTSTSLKLKKFGYVVETQSDANGVVSSVASFQPDLILLDVVMPGMSGIEVLKKIRLVYSPIELPVIMVTSTESTDVITSALKFGANDYISKPINIEVTVARMQTQLTTASLHRELMEKKELEAIHALIVTYNHEINSPLNIALLNLDCAADSGDLKSIENARSALLRVAEIVKNIASIKERGFTYTDYLKSTKMISIKKNY